MICCFIGNRVISQDVATKLRETIIELIENQGVDTFYVGNQGQFDKIVYEELENLKKLYPHIKIYVVLAYKPTKDKNIYSKYQQVIYPDCMRFSTFKSAIPIRNRWMIETSDILVSYVAYEGNASRFVEMARKKKKQIINIANK